MSKPMSLTTTRLPPRAGFNWRGMPLALLAHSCLIAALTWGTSWRSDDQITTISAELWSELPSLGIEPSQHEPEQVPVPVPKVPAPDIKTLRAIKPAQTLLRSTELLNKQRQQDRQDQIKRMEGLARNASQSAAPSSGYSGKVKAKVWPNIVFQNAELTQGDPTVEIAIRLAADGTILLPLKMVKSSGNSAWDTAVLRGVEKTQTLPRDSNGTFPGPFTLIWHLKERAL